MSIEYDGRTGKPIYIDEREFKVRYRSSLGFLEEYFRGLEEGRILAVRCMDCGARYYPPRSFCIECGSRNIRFYQLSDVGKLVTYTEINVKPQTHSDYTDYIVGVVEVDGVKLVGHVHAKFEDLKPDIDVSISVDRRDGDTYYRIIFKPLERD